ncbi:MAG: hypothetical protein ACLFM8_00375 [Halobacteriales archaeon]
MALAQRRVPINVDDLLEAIGGTLGLVAIALAVLILGYTLTETAGADVSPILLSTALFALLVLVSLRLASRFIPQPSWTTR